MSTEIISNETTHIVCSLKSKDAHKLSNYLPVRLRDFWLTMHPLAQAYIYNQSNSPEEFFVLVDMENARFEKEGKAYNKRDRKWEKSIQVIEKLIVFKDME